MIPRPLFLPVAAVAVLAFGAGCGDGGSNSTSTPTAPRATPTISPATEAATEATSPTTLPTPTKPASATAPADGTIDPLGGGQTTPWTVKPPKEPVSGIATVKDVRMGVHPEQGGWERIVFEFAGDAWPPGVVQYVDRAVSCGSGQPVAGLKGNAVLEIAVTSAQAHDNAGKATIPQQITGPGKTVGNGLQSCDFEGHVTWDFGLTGKQNFKVSTLANPPRIVIDVKQ